MLLNKLRSRHRMKDAKLEEIPEPIPPVANTCLCDTVEE